MFLRHPCQCQMGNPASNPTGSVRDPYGAGLEPVGGWRLVAGLSSKLDRIPPPTARASGCGQLRGGKSAGLEPVGRWRLVAGLSSKPDRIPPLAQQAVAVA